MIIYTFLTLLFFSAFGTLLGMLVRQRRHVTTLCLASAVPIFFASGPLGPVTFSTKAIQIIASLFPASYAIAAEQHAFHNFDTNTLGAWNALVLVCFILVCTIAALHVLRRSSVTH
jgi:ABC-type multidrug transport system permease subunit